MNDKFGTFLLIPYVNYDNFAHRFNKIFDAVVSFQFSTLYDHLFIFDTMGPEIYFRRYEDEPTFLLTLAYFHGV